MFDAISVEKLKNPHVKTCDRGPLQRFQHDRGLIKGI